MFDERDYTIAVGATTTNSATQLKAVKHLKFSLHWSRAFTVINQSDETTLKGTARWENLENDMKNFSIYYPNLVFEVTTEDLTRKFAKGKENKQ